MGPRHPERPERLERLMHIMETTEFATGSSVRLPERLATRNEVIRAHQPDHFEQIARTEGQHVTLDPDTSTSPQSFEAALAAAGCTIQATESVVDGTVDRAFAMVRPPGHHAEPTHAMGFCLFNNAAVAAAHAIERLGLQRVAVIDFDVHHGNGTQSAFYDNPDVFYFSSHQFPYYPGTGTVQEAGSGNGLGTTVNVPLRAGHGDDEYAAIYGALLPRMLEQYRPELILVSAGFDLMAEDPLADMCVSPGGVHAIASSLVQCADRLCDGRVVFVLEGGYSLDALSQGVTATLNAAKQSGTEGTPLPPIVDTELGDAARFLPLYRELYQL